MKRLALDYKKKIVRDPGYHDRMTTLVEFARGGEEAIRNALAMLPDEILGKAALVYIRVSYEESVRKNRRRARKGEEDSILYHSLPDEKMDFYYKTNDWEKIEAANPDYIEIRGGKVPYAVFENMPERTLDPKLIEAELRRVTGNLWKKFTS
jgi:hypothetical protein